MERVILSSWFFSVHWMEGAFWWAWHWKSNIPLNIWIDLSYMAENEEELKSLLMKVKGEWKKWLKAQHSENEDRGIWSHHFMAKRWGNSENSVRLYFFGLQNHCRWWLQPWNWKMLAPWKKSYDKLNRVLERRDATLVTKVHIIKAMFFPVVVWELDHKEGWAPRNWCF